MAAMGNDETIHWKRTRGEKAVIGCSLSRAEPARGPQVLNPDLAPDMRRAKAITLGEDARTNKPGI